MPRATKAALAAPNVIALPGAAARKINNWRYAAQYRAARDARAADPWPGEYKLPHHRRAENEAKTLAELTKSPELLIVMTMMEMMDVEQQAALAGKVAAYANVLGDDASTAAAFITQRLATAAKRSR